MTIAGTLSAFTSTHLLRLDVLHSALSAIYLGLWHRGIKACLHARHATMLRHSLHILELLLLLRLLLNILNNALDLLLGLLRDHDGLCGGLRVVLVDETRKDQRNS